MNLEEAVVWIETYVENVQGCKATELAAAMPQEVELFLEAVDVAVETGRIVEVCYTVPNLAFREKSFFLPRGSTLMGSFGES